MLCATAVQQFDPVRRCGVSADPQEKCVQWAKDGECTRNKEYMAEYCKLSCTHCTPRNGSRPMPNDQLHPLTVAAIQAEAGPSLAPEAAAAVPPPQQGHARHESGSAKTGPPATVKAVASRQPSAGTKGDAEHEASSVTFDTLIRR